jgi:hypothetical protein
VPTTTADADTGKPQSDLIYRETRWLAIIIVPFLLIAFYILFLRTSETKALFAWEIGAPMTAMMLGSAYIGGAYFFTRASRAKHWHLISVGFLPVATFASFMGIATILSWDKFTHDHVSFYTWVVLYFTTPFLVLAAWLRNRRTDPGIPDSHDFVLSRAARYVLGAAGLFNIVLSILLLIAPQGMINIWPWTLTVLTARVVGGMFALQGMFGLCMALDGRWSAARITLESQLVSMLFIVIATLRTWSTFDQSRPFTWVFVISISAILIVVIIFYIFVENYRKRRRPASN